MPDVADAGEGGAGSLVGCEVVEPEGKFDGVGGETTVRSLRCMARNGRLMLIGFASAIEAGGGCAVPVVRRPQVTPRPSI